MPTLEDIRQQYPQYDSLSDGQIADALYERYYAGKLDRSDFNARIGFTPEPEKPYLESEYDKAMVGTQGMVEGIPIIGPYLKDASESFAGSVSSLITGRPKGELMKEYRARQNDRIEDNQGDYVTGQLAGGIAPFLGVGMAPKGVQSALGMTGSLGARTLKSGASSLAIGTADQAARDFSNTGELSGENLLDAGLMAGGIGAAIPGVGHVAGKAVNAAANKAGDAFHTVFNPTKQAARRVGQAINLDRANEQGALSRSDIASATRSNQPLLNVDLGGETTRALTRATVNQSPEARGAIERAVQDRFSSQAARLSEKVRGIAGNVDDLSTIEQIRSSASASNKPAYQKAFLNPKAQSLYTPRLRELMQSPTFRSAVNLVPKRSADRGAVEGFKEIPNPFRKNAQGGYILKQDGQGTVAVPNLEFWNQVKINLDTAIDRAKRSDGKTRVAELTSLKNALVEELDKAVPAYREARQGAAVFFQAEDAVDAGRKFFKSSRMMPEYRNGILKMTTEEREAFKVGFASEILDAAGATADNHNVINRYFRSPDAREKIKLAFGKSMAQEFEAFVRVENAMDQLRNALGNSTTARQLLESGMLGNSLVGAAAWTYTGDFSTGVAAAAGRMGTRVLGRKISDRVLKETADLLLSNDPKAIERAIQMAARSPQHMASLDAISQMLALSARGAAIQVSTEK
ncbi:hypothetical protein [Roseibium sp. MMSF_3544]|uniref:hypothetical protein n=1 Tax=unclassified Roseibium TaxID=2629323 RepID=UPI00273D08B3|nr:hypothetical protein [Roseibium sp. MMSF_3544]